ncbi:SDR family NAD(P)-dependent oxidoreductase [Natronogracilivirga saccharolytica]|uniref:SDR family oxidoreductase n=1 Tax=Natronogracilivirga saccharolytica TaxID=2812953 RepID=A0A8J7UUV9_9BACT|nr:SDR family oxidoreductase [Natronogracilivirga saccharolytica]MBP3192800.1 SDR family oxidoreductase [Natronogracilivirga saccharolytica]
MEYYKNKTVLVTGASSGIGISFSRLLASYGADLVITARRKDRLEKLADEISREFKSDVTIIACDLSEPESAAKLVEDIGKKGLQIDILVNNAGFGFNGLFMDGSVEMYEQMMQLNMNTLVSLTRLLLPDMIRRGEGGVLNVSSMAGFLPIPYFSVYSATKQFVINFSRSLRRELRSTGVHVSVLCPGPVRTEFMSRAGVDRRKTAFRLPQNPEEVALKGLRGLVRNRSLQLSRSFLRIPYLLSKWLPVRLGLVIGEVAMKK